MCSSLFRYRYNQGYIDLYTLDTMNNILAGGLPSSASYIRTYMCLNVILLIVHVYMYIPRTATINEFLQVSFDPSRSRFSCLFAESVGNGYKSCNIVYGLKDPVTDESNGCFSSVKSRADNTTNSFITDTVTVYVPTLAQTGLEFCFFAIGTVATFSVTVAVEGTFMTGTWNSGCDH